jgi:hypothetical protein
VLHILSPIVRQIREMNSRLPKRRKTTLDPRGNITVDEFYFRHDTWCRMVPLSVDWLKRVVCRLADGIWWEAVVDVASEIQISVDNMSGDIIVQGVMPTWKANLALNEVDTFTAILEMAFHGFGGGGARMSELESPTMLHCLYSNDAIYYSLGSIKVFNHASRKHRQVERKLPRVISRFFLLFRSLIQSHNHLFSPEDIGLLLPSRKDRVDFGIRHVVREIFDLHSLPDMTQVRHLWAGVSNYVTGCVKREMFCSSSEAGATKMGHSMITHSLKYSSEIVGSDEAHFDCYHEAIGDPSVKKMEESSDEVLSLYYIREAMRLRHGMVHGSNYLSSDQKELVEFAYGSGGSNVHCIALLGPGEGKSECYIIPTMARHLANQRAKTIIHISPYCFLMGYQYANATAVFTKHSLKDITTAAFTGGEISEGNLPEELQNSECLPHLMFLNLEAMHNLFHYFPQTLRSWRKSIDKIVIDEAHTILTELSFREKYSVYSCLPALGIPIVLMTGSLPLFSVPRFTKRLGLSLYEDGRDMKVVRGGRFIGDFPSGFVISVEVCDKYLANVVDFVMGKVGSGPCAEFAAHVFVSEKREGTHIFNALSSRLTCRLVTSETDIQEVREAADSWCRGLIDVLITTSIGLVGNENPRCRYLAMAGHFFDLMQVVQAMGRLRSPMRAETGAIFIAAPSRPPDHRYAQDEHLWTRLCHEQFMNVDNRDEFDKTLTSKGVFDWLIDASVGKSSCSVLQMALLFGKQVSNCGACLYCRRLPVQSMQLHCDLILSMNRQHDRSTARILRRLMAVCLACGQESCRGLPILRGRGSASLPENRGCCFSWNRCYKCGVSDHDRKQCFDNTYMYNVACCECWVLKNISGTYRHETSNCPTKGRLRRLLSHHYMAANIEESFKDYIESIYTSRESFTRFMARMDDMYNRVK